MPRYRDNGYWANTILFLGTSVFWIAPITGVPHVLPDESDHYLEWDFLYWLPQVLCRHNHPFMLLMGLINWH